jgi:exopolysaccharide biosynthesis polyprenyl glycosylphosphotransferase
MSGPLATSRLGHGGAELVWRPAPRLRRATRSDGARPVARALIDLLSLIIAAGISGSDDAAVLGAWEWPLIAVAVAVLAATGAYRPRRRLRLDYELRRVVAGIGLACITVAATAMLLGGRSGIGDAVTVLWLAGSAVAGAGRLALYAGERATAGRGTAQGRTLIVGAGHVGRLTARRLLARPQLGLRPVGFLDKEPLDAADAPALPLPVLGASWDLERVVEAEEIDTVVVAFSTAPHQVLLDLVRRSWELGADVMLVPRLYEVEGRRLRTQHLGGLPLIAVGTSDPRGFAFTLKYAIDRIVAGVALVLLAPVLALTALAVRCSLGRPILFRQQRVGLDGHVFDMLKFRTMHGAPDQHGEADADWAALVLAGEAGGPAAARTAAVSRRSRVGDFLRKLSLDELPQLWNVVRGDMSLVGPRPERSHYVEQFEGVVYRYGDRHRVKSGLTGWAQVHGLRGETSLADRIEWDNFYIENWSFWLDLKIVVMTLPALVGRRGGH